MTQINFYSLHSADLQSRLQFACRLTEKARSLGHRVFIQSESDQQARALSELLWQFRPGAFLPHTVNAQQDQADAEAVAIGQATHARWHGDVLINLDRDACQSPERFSRINEIICAAPDVLALGRTRYREYAAAGHTLETFKL